MKKIILALLSITCISVITCFGFTAYAASNDADMGENINQSQTKEEYKPETPDNNDKMPPKTSETGKVEEDDFTTEITKEDTLKAFLDFMQKTADEAGIGDEYRKAVEAIKTAATEKQVTISTIASVAQLAVFIVYLIYLNVKNGKLKKAIIELSEKLDTQLKGTNGLIDESNANGELGKNTNKQVEEIKTDVNALKRSQIYTLNGLATFVDRFNIGAASKETVRTQFNKAAGEIDGAITVAKTIEGVTRNEESKA